MKRKQLLIVSGVVFVVGAIYLLTRKKSPKAKEITEVPNNPTPPKNIPTTAKKVLILKPGANVYADNEGKIGKVTRYSKSPNETAGSFIGYRTINKSVYVLFADTFNSGKKSLVLKSFTNYSQF